MNEQSDMRNFLNSESPVWRLVDYADREAQNSILQSVYLAMINAGQSVVISEETIRQVELFYPDLRTMKKQERKPILREKQKELKELLRIKLRGLKGSYHLRVYDSFVTAVLYDTGIKEVMKKITRDKACMLFHSARIFQNARYLYSTPDYDKNPNIDRWNYFCVPVKIGFDFVCVRIAVRDMTQNELHEPESQIYHWGIKQIDKTDAALGGGKPD